jgi:site-specific recombinase XerD
MTPGSSDVKGPTTIGFGIMLTATGSSRSIGVVAPTPRSRRLPDRHAAARPDARFEPLAAAWLATHRSANTQAAYRGDLERFAQWCAERGVDPLAPSVRDMVRYRTSWEDGGSRPASVARRLSSVGSFLRYAAANGSPGASDAYTGLARPDTGDDSRTPALSEDDAAALLEAADALHPKAALLVRLLMLDGLKVGEAVAADADDLTGRAPRTSLRLERQGRTQVIALHGGTALAARAYLAGRRTGPLLVGDGQARDGGRLTRFGADYIVKRAAEGAGLGPHISANVLRRRFVTAAHADGTDLDDIRRRAGHVDERTTRRYLPPGP